MAAFVLVSGSSAVIAGAAPGGSHGNGGSNHGSGNSGNGQGGNSGNGNSGNGGSTARGNSGNNAPKTGGNNGNGNGNNGNGNNGNGNGSTASAQSNGGSSSGANNPAANPGAATAMRVPPRPIVVAEQHVGSSTAQVGPPALLDVALPADRPQPLPAAPPRDEAPSDLQTIEHTLIPVWTAIQPAELRGDLFGLAGLILMPLVGLAVGYRQAKAARDVGLVNEP
ncbi:hypothetical protein FZI85_07035 [Mycobacterium sp. CBMA293]|uniref:hypothetical protein n=1 Tax=unclassified Mycolicibacterium TaxID=2636767 RepID=UPI0012DEB768|nr:MULTISPECIES: hypothetical protein [unclassified Mycolicibacterium]MUL45324.1 hypothetical protein [Mycolicibacterium sp. CBMA 360]MUL56844.1 hypothetical protein [Mycolicibacterium sp. CBMA 335]MUL69883.1 hypothetical protein [Mycolicibacterium sp. CBMA 311]MUL91931.1 hypothetical protein [Mycolicibacterium sp. CBMA 230]MUM05670.1 hypothetical protein [Mycolicibacterium sp. CBMA 213]